MLDTAVPVTTVAVRNLTKTNVILSGETKGSAIEWGYAGCPDGSDLQEVPTHVWNSAHMRRAKARGILAEDSMEAMDVAFDRQRAALAATAAERQAEVNAALQAGAAGAPIIISEDALAAHMKATESRQPSKVLVEAQEAQAAADRAARDAAREADAAVQAAKNPLAAIEANL